MERANSNKPVLFRKRLIVLIVASALAGCATFNKPGEFSEEELKLSQYATMTSVDAVRKLEQNYKSSINSDLPVFAPKHYSTAGKALDEAQNLLSQNGPRDQIVHKVAVGHAVLRNADHVVEKVKETLSDELELKNKLESLNTDAVYSTEYGSLLDRLNQVIQSIEAGKTDVAENREKLIKDMQQLEQKARRYNAMHEPEEILKRVKYSGGEKLAPLTYREAVEVFKRAEEFIKQNPTYETGIEQVGREALFAAKRALYITQEVAALSQKMNLSPEQIVLDEEYRLHRIAREITHKDFRDHPIEVQSELLAKTALEQASEIKSKDELVIALRDTLIKVRDSSTQLTSLSETASQLKEEKNEWLAKDALYRSKIQDLEEKLAESIAQLDQTQQKLLGISTENTELTQALAQTKQNIELLNQQLAEATSQSETAQQVQTATSTEDKPVEENIASDSTTPAIANNTDQQETAVVTETQAEPATEKLAAENTNKPELPENNVASSDSDTTTAETQIASKPESDDTPAANAVNTITDKDHIEIAEQAAMTEKESQASEQLAEQKTAETENNKVANTEKTKVTREETLKALESAKELIKVLQAQNNKDNAPTDTTQDNQRNQKPVKKDIFVDASE